MGKMLKCKDIIGTTPDNKHTKGFYLGKLRDYSHEKEFLINNGVKYKIINISDNILEVEIL